MGARTQVLIKDTGVYLYSHWGSGNILETVGKAIDKHWRWNDPEYLARIILETMIGKNSGAETGFGIGTKMHGDIDNLVTVDCDKQLVTFENMGSDHNKGEFSFEDLCHEFDI